MGKAQHGWALRSRPYGVLRSGIGGSTSVSRTKTSPSESPEPANMLRRVAEGLCHATRKVSSHWIGVVPNPMAGDLVRKERLGDRDTHRGKGRVTTGTEIGVMHLQPMNTKDWGPPSKS